MFGKGITRKELAQNYGVCRRTLAKWLKEKNIDLHPGLITPKDQESIYSKVGYPKNDFKIKGPFKQ